MISQQVWREQEKFFQTFRKPKIYQWVTQTQVKKNKARLKKKKSWLDKPLKKTGNDSEIDSFIDRQAKLIRAEQVVIRRRLKEVYNQSPGERYKLQNKIRETRRVLVDFTIACEKLRKLIESEE